MNAINMRLALFIDPMVPHGIRQRVPLVRGDMAVLVFFERGGHRLPVLAWVGAANKVDVLTHPTKRRHPSWNVAKPFGFTRCVHGQQINLARFIFVTSAHKGQPISIG